MLLDEPLAELVPLARRAAMCLVMAEVAERSATVVYSTHVLAELETVCDHVVVLGRGRVLVHGEVEALVGSHSVVTGPALQLARLGQCVGGGPGGGTGTLVLERPPLASTTTAWWHVRPASASCAWLTFPRNAQDTRA